MGDALRLRFVTFALAALLVCGVLAAALYARVVWRGAPAQPDAAPVVSIWRDAAPAMASAPFAPPVSRGTESAVPQDLQDALQSAAPGSALAGIAQAARGEGFATYGDGRDLPPARVEGVRTRDGALERTIARAAQARVTEYARGEAQRYADPREDPLYEEGTDPATAAHRPCPPGTQPRGDGRALRGRTCRPVR